MPIPGAPSDSSSPLADLLGNVNRPQLNSFVATANARNGLVSAQTQEAMTKASQAQEQQQAWDDFKTLLIKNGAKESQADLMRAALVGSNNHDPEAAMKVGAQAMLGFGSPQEQVSGQQMYQGKVAPLETAPGNFVTAPTLAATNAAGPGAPPPTINQNPQAQAQTAEAQALADLNAHKNTTPSDFRNPAVFGTLTPEGQAALTRAIREHRLDPTKVNARNAPILAQTELQAPGTNFDRLHADAALQSNPTFQQRSMGLEIMPGILSHLTSLGKALNDGTGYSDIRTVGQMQKFMNGELNDPAYAEYMPVRNDAILRLAYLMRGQGASNMAAKLEEEANAPTLAPYALDAWMKGQMSVIKPMIEKNNTIAHKGEGGIGGTPPLTAPNGELPANPPAPASLGNQVPGAAPAGPVPLDQYLKSKGF